jgi:hypothetical protein
MITLKAAIIAAANRARRGIMVFISGGWRIEIRKFGME